MTSPASNASNDQLSPTERLAYEAFSRAVKEVLANKPKTREDRAAEALGLRAEYAKKRKSFKRRATITYYALVLGCLAVTLYRVLAGHTENVIEGWFIVAMIVIGIGYVVYGAESFIYDVERQEEEEAWRESGHDDLTEKQSIDELAVALESNEVARTWAKAWFEQSGRVSVEDARVLINFVNCGEQVASIEAGKSNVAEMMKVIDGPKQAE